MSSEDNVRVGVDHMGAGVVAAGAQPTAEAAAKALAAGGNAVDAVVAGALAAFVAEPMLASAGGAGILVASLNGGTPKAVDFFPSAPVGATTGPVDFDGIEVDFGSATQEFHVGRAAAAVPLALPGLALAARELGRLDLSTLVEPAARMAREGVALSAATVHVFQLLAPIIERDPQTRTLFMPNGLPKAGDAHRNPQLADTLEAFAREGGIPEDMAQAMLAEFGTDRGGSLTALDLESCTASLSTPLRISLGHWDVHTSPRVGGRLLRVILEQLRGGAPLADEPAEIVRTALASREGHRARSVPPGPGSTTHLSAIDAEGGVAAMTLTNGEGCGYLVPGTGVQLNNFLGEEDLNPGGFHRHGPGALLPTMIAPTIALREGGGALALGSGGANRIRSSVSQVLYRVVRLGEPLDEAVRAPRVHAEDDRVWIELETLRDPDSVLSALREHFQHVYPFNRRDFFFGGVHAAERTPDGELQGAADARRGGAVVRSEAPGPEVNT